MPEGRSSASEWLAMNCSSEEVAMVAGDTHCKQGRGAPRHGTAGGTCVGFLKMASDTYVPSVGDRQIFHVSEWITANTSFDVTPL